jgi:PPE-repeat protein
MTTPTNLKAPYLRTQREFPYDDVKTLANQTDHAYIDIAQKVNSRTIGVYPTNVSIATGDRWFEMGGDPDEVQQSLRQVYPFSTSGNIPHGLNWASVSAISPRSYGTYTDGTNQYGVIYASSTSISGQVSFYVTSTNIVVVADAGAPTISTGLIILEWISQV